MSWHDGRLLMSFKGGMAGVDLVLMLPHETCRIRACFHLGIKKTTYLSILYMVWRRKAGSSTIVDDHG
jgi:hypothetical protein